MNRTLVAWDEQSTPPPPLRSTLGSLISGDNLGIHPDAVPDQVDRLAELVEATVLVTIFSAATAPFATRSTAR